MQRVNAFSIFNQCFFQEDRLCDQSYIHITNGKGFFTNDDLLITKQHFLYFKKLSRKPQENISRTYNVIHYII